MPKLSITNVDWPKTILHLRKVLLFTQNDLANGIKMTPATISKWERGKSNPRLSAFRSLKKLALSNGISEENWLIKTAVSMPKLIRKTNGEERGPL